MKQAGRSRNRIVKMDTSKRLERIYTDAALRTEGYDVFNCPIFQKELYHFARELVKDVDDYNRNVNLTLCEVENYMEEDDDIEYDYLAEQLYDDVYSYVNGMNYTKYFWYKQSFDFSKTGKILFTNCILKKDIPSGRVGDHFPHIELDFIKTGYTFYKEEGNFATEKYWLTLNL